jgi:hypothetical protein
MTIIKARKTDSSKEDEPMTNNIRFGLKSLLTLAALLLAACSFGKPQRSGSTSSSTGTEHNAGGPCKNVEICTVIPQSQVNESLGVTALNCIPDQPTASGGMTSDQSAYLNAKDSTNVQLLRQCYSEAQTAAAFYQSSQQSYLKPGGTRDDLGGVGEKAFYETVPAQSAPKTRLVALKGNLYVVLSDEHVPSGQETIVKQGLTSFANTLLNAK